MMGNFRGLLLAVTVVFFFVSCGSSPETEQQDDHVSSPGEAAGESQVSASEKPAPQVPAAPAVFDAHNVSRELFEQTKLEVQRFIDQLNNMISQRNYEAWKSSLSPEFFARIASAEHLQSVSDTDIMKAQRIVLRNAEDYFFYVVVPSRTASRVDEIEFISENRVKAYMINVYNDGTTLWIRLFDLEKNGNMWMIIN
jgi:hypothetical protein